MNQVFLRTFAADAARQDHETLVRASKIIRTILDAQAASQAATLFPGTNVYFRDKRGRHVEGVIFPSKGRKNVKVRANNGAMWTVHPSFIHVIGETIEHAGNVLV